MTTALADVPSIEIGERLRKAREGAGVTQAEAAAAAGIARTTLVAIEQGLRCVRIEEAQKLAKLYDVSLNAVLRREAVHVDLVPRFRKLARSDTPVEEATALLASLVAAEVELEDLLGVRRETNLPPERPIVGTDVRRQAEQDAIWLRQWLGLGQGPVHDMIGLFELEIGARVYIRPVAPTISGLFAFDESVGACILLNGAHPRERRALSAAHELAHLISTRRQPDVQKADARETAKEERYATTFAAGFLMPERAVAQKFRAIVAGSERLTRRHVIVLAHAFGVSREALVRRLEDLNLVPVQTWDWFADNGGITDDQSAEVLGLPAQRDEDGRSPIGLRLGILAEEVWRRELMSEGQLSRLLRLDRVALRAMLDSLTSDESRRDGAVLFR